MINVDVKNEEPEVFDPEDYDYPLLLKSNLSGGIILCTGFDHHSGFTGTVLKRGSMYATGYWADDWHISNFVPFEGSITLTNA